MGLNHFCGFGGNVWMWGIGERGGPVGLCLLLPGFIPPPSVHTVPDVHTP